MRQFPILNTATIHSINSKHFHSSLWSQISSITTSLHKLRVSTPFIEQKITNNNVIKAKKHFFNGILISISYRKSDWREEENSNKRYILIKKETFFSWFREGFVSFFVNSYFGVTSTRQPFSFTSFNAQHFYNRAETVKRSQKIRTKWY